MPRPKILLVEDHTELRERIAQALRDAGFDAEEASDGRLGLSLALEAPPDALVLDLGLPGLDGLTVCQRLREHLPQRVPVLMLTARDALDEKLQGFTAGADDYLTKPFATPELIARVNALLRRGAVEASSGLRLGDLVLEPLSRTAQREGVALALSPAAFSLLHSLMLAHPRAVSRARLIETLWPDGPPGDGDADGDVLRTHVFALRQALDKPFAHPMLITVHGLGFRLALPPSA